MTKLILMMPAWLPLVATVGLGCRDVSEAADDAVTITVGAESLRAVDFEQSMTVEADRIPPCADFSATLPSTQTTVAQGNTPTGCVLTVEQPALVLLDEQEIERARAETRGFDVSAIRGVTFEVQSFALSTADGAALELSQYVQAVTLTMDGEVLLDRVAVGELQATATAGTLRRDLPASLLEKLKVSLENNEAATADVAISIWLPSDGAPELPDTLHVRVVMQPELEVNVVDAVL